MDDQRFSLAKEYVLQNRTHAGIGTLGEKTIHAVLKQYYEPHPENHEVLIGEFVADIVTEQGIMEIQTRQFEKLQRKLKSFLSVSSVTVLYPVVVRKRIHWIDAESGELTQQGRWFRSGSVYSFFKELYRIKSFLPHPNLSFRILELTAEEYRLLNGYGGSKKQRAKKLDSLPVELLKEWHVNTPQDFFAFLPQGLPDEFDSEIFAKKARISRGIAQTTLQILTELNVVIRLGKKGRAYLYRIACNPKQETVQ